MPKPMLRAPEAKNNSFENSILSASNNQSRENKKQQEVNKMQIDRLLRKKRSKEYMEAMKSLDSGGHVTNKGEVDSIIQKIKDEFPEVEISGILLGVVSICCLGKPYEVHTIDMSGSIIEHYKSGNKLPNGLEKARGIAMYGGYDFVEVYIDCCRAVSSDGTVSVIPN